MKSVVLQAQHRKQTGELGFPPREKGEAPQRPTRPLGLHRLTLEMVLLSHPVIPERSASKLKMLSSPIWERISSRLYVAEMENLGKCKSSRLGREPEKWYGLVNVALAHLLAAWAVEGQVFPSVGASGPP